MLLAIFLFIHAIVALPVPRFITIMQTAPAITSTRTYTTGTTTVWLPPVEIFISNGVTYTFTHSEWLWATTPVTLTSVFEDAAGQLTSTTCTDTSTQTSITTQTTSSTQTTIAQTVTEITNAETNGETIPATTQTTTSSPSAAVPETTTAVSETTTAVPESTTAGTTSTALTILPQTTQINNNNEIKLDEVEVDALETSSSLTSSALSVTTQAPTTTSILSPLSSASSSPSGKILPPSYIVYSPYTNDRQCKDHDTIQSDLQLIQSKGISKLRIYSVDCNTMTDILPLAQSMGMKVNQGFWIDESGVDSIDGAVSTLIEWAATNTWDLFEFITVGNEAVLANFCSVSDLIGKISSVKQQLRAAGYNGPITTSEPPATYIASPALCTEAEIDFVGVNPHSYFNTNLNATQAGEYIAGQLDQVAKICSKKAFITETGYPHKGNTNGNNVPSPENQYIAIESIIDHTGGDVTILTTFDDFWKAPGPYNVEQYFGTIDLF